LEISEPGATYAFFSSPLFPDDSASIILENTTLVVGKKVAAALRNSTGVALFVGTCGEKVELLSKQLMHEKHLLESLIVDLIGSEIAEEVAAIVHKEIENIAAGSGLKVTNRYSPGYCNWPVSDQQKLFSLLKGKTGGVRLTNSSLMIPIKSVSGIIGIGESMAHRSYACAKCDTAYCLYRDKK
jgi:hypothetical protein